ncbi:MAG: hypothetical protein WBB45_04250 [Cyclobacteriaceae bacterium]
MKPGTLNIRVDSVGSSFEHNVLTLIEQEEGAYASDEFYVSSFDRFNIEGTTYEDITQLEVLDMAKTPMRKLWLVSGSGLVGLEKFGSQCRRD